MTRSLIDSWVFAALLAAAGCSTARPVEHESALPPAPDSSAAGPSKLDLPASAAPSASAAPTANAAPSGSDPKRFACENVTCASGSETCCIFSDAGACIPNGAAGAHDINKLRETCDHTPARYSLSGMSQCDESVDCDGNDLCCAQVLFSGAKINACLPPTKTGGTPCDYGEVCREGSPCRQPGTVCSDGHCIKDVQSIRCGSSTCSGTTPACCGSPPVCSAASACDWRSRIACTSDRDCVKGHRCVVDGELSRCIGTVIDPEQLRFACETSADCVKCTSVRGAKPSCAPGMIPWLKECECPYGP